jgi:NADPH:quinone reductase-like Zn-dependent oxidoreductase
MKAAVLHEIGGIPTYEDFPDPVAGPGEILIDVVAVAVENVDKMIAAGTHFAARQFTSHLPAIPGFDGVGTLPDGTLVGFSSPRAPYGALAEQTVVAESSVVPVPDGIDPAVAVALPSAVTGFAIKSAARFTAGETVLIQGATGVAGRLAVKVAGLLGAGRIVATGRDDDALGQLHELGADTVINTAVPDEALIGAFTDAKGEGYDVVLDFLWGRPTELLLRALVPDELTMAKPTRLIQVGESAGPTLTLAAESLRTSGVELYGVTKGLDATTMMQAYQQAVQRAQDGTLTFDIERVPLSQIQPAWQRTDLRGRRLVVMPDRVFTKRDRAA